jgi:hypothetical protein
MKPIQVRLGIMGQIQHDICWPNYVDKLMCVLVLFSWGRVILGIKISFLYVELKIRSSVKVFKCKKCVFD